MNHILEELITNNEIEFDFDKEEILEVLKKIKRQYLYSSEFHGLHHSQKVCLFAYLLGKYYNLTTDELKILLDAAVYHDIGRISDNEDSMHGYTSSMKIGKVVKYSDDLSLGYLKAISEAHCLDDKFDEKIFNNYQFDYPNLEYSKYKKLLDLLKDADALDRTRFSNPNVYLMVDKLRTNYARKLVDLAIKINMLYKDKISYLFYKDYSKKFLNNNGDYACFHSIGFDFFRINSILENGIVSKYASMKKGINIKINFDGNNNMMWVSVTEMNGLRNNDKAYNDFVLNGISFLCFVPNLVDGIITNKNSGDMMPRKTNEYKNEKFVFYEIKNEWINSIIVPSEYKDKTIDSIYYLQGNSNYELLENKVYYYIDNCRKLCNYNFDTSKIKDLLDEYKNEAKKYESMNEVYQRNHFLEFISKLDVIKNKINSEVQTMMFFTFKIVCQCDNPTVTDVLSYFIKKSNLELQFITNEEETIYKLKIKKIL